ncbi:lipid A biosynthesis lauroyl acyltransferase [Actinobacillus equuli]|nr:lipid A biosynthesis lauroyl acyltransferase [Actinobacillus equuli]
MGARIVGLHHQGVGVYRPNDNPLLDWIQFRGRVRSNKAMLDRKDLRGMIRALKAGDTIWYAPDHDYGRKIVYLCRFLLYRKPVPRRVLVCYYGLRRIRLSCRLAQSEMMIFPDIRLRLVLQSILVNVKMNWILQRK